MIFIVSDAHFGSGENSREREELFLDFLRKVKDEGRGLILLGDIFDFWFEYRHYVNAHYFDVLAAILDVARKVPVVYVAGNHDLWIDGFFERRGVKVVKDVYYMDGLAFAHGDNLRSGIRTRDILLNPLLVRMFYALHPDLGYAIARFVSSGSRKRNQDVKEIPEWMWRYVLSRIDARTVVVGHLHVPMVEERAGRKIVCVGDWMKNYTYGVLSSGVLKVMQYGSEVLFSVPVDFQAHPDE